MMKSLEYRDEESHICKEIFRILWWGESSYKHMYCFYCSRGLGSAKWACGGVLILPFMAGLLLATDWLSYRQAGEYPPKAAEAPVAYNFPIFTYYTPAAPLFVAFNLLTRL
jgi:hypothetical protein